MEENELDILKALDFAPESSVSLDEVLLLPVSYVIENPYELYDVIISSHEMGIIDDSGKDTALAFVDSVRYSESPEAIIAGLPYEDDGSRLLVKLIFPCRRDGNE